MPCICLHSESFTIKEYTNEEIVRTNEFKIKAFFGIFSSILSLKITFRATISPKVSGPVTFETFLAN